MENGVDQRKMLNESSESPCQTYHTMTSWHEEVKLRENSQFEAPINYYKLLMKILELMIYKPSIGNYTKNYGS
ncbi:hypothetical protein EPI10_021824 [Gossypium australe]|uniref:Uncharacterized protein n=1 Tax=Gossypium australe TaxID=47621 RepID=A0A5B6WJP3_9ROSI|nr:hypothetical protein EPI10_021824 [Gossypium australe]